MSLSEDQINFYKQNGYLMLPNVIGEDNLQKLRGKINEFIEKSRSVACSNEMFDLDATHSSAHPCVRRLKDPHTQDPLFDTLSRCDEILDPVADLLGGTVRFDHSKLNFKPAGGDAAISWHQDWAFYPHTNDDILVVGVMIEDCTHTNGPLMVIPESHRGPIHNHHQNEWFTGGVSEDDISEMLDSAVEVVGSAGSITIHHVRTLHASGNNMTNSTRPLLLFSYTAVDAFPVFQSYDIAEYDLKILRGEPTTVGRMEAVPFRISQPQVPKADSIYDSQAMMTR